VQAPQRRVEIRARLLDVGVAQHLLDLVPIPIVSTIIGASPLSIKFLLSGQLQSAIRDGTIADLRQGS